MDGTAILYLHAGRLDVRIQEGAPVARQEFRFHDPLPGTQQNVRLSVMEGRGYVRIVDQPRLDNQYTLAVQVEDRQPGAAFYSIALYWETAGNLFERSGTQDSVTWTGRVDRDAIVSCAAKTCSSAVSGGLPVAAERFKFSSALPSRDLEVRILHAEGRGEIRLVEQPRESNKYSARVSIRDPQDGASEYAFTLAWIRPKSGRVANAPPPRLDAARGLVWSGEVTGRIRVTIRGGLSFSEGGGVRNEHAEFLRPFPAQSDLSPVVRKVAGRGSVEIAETPSEKNNYQLVVEVADPGPGAGSYVIEVAW